MDWSKFKYFTKEEMACPCCGKAEMDEGFMQMLEALRIDCGFPLPVTSGYRCRRHNAEVGGAADSPHLYGRAADIAVYGTRAYELLRHALDIQFSGIGIKQDGRFGGRFIHLDNMDDGKHLRPTIWSYGGKHGKS